MLLLFSVFKWFKNVTSGFSLSRFSLNQQREPANSITKKFRPLGHSVPGPQSNLKWSRSGSGLAQPLVESNPEVSVGLQ